MHDTATPELLGRALRERDEARLALPDELGHSDAARVKPDDLAAYLRTLVASGLKPNTVDDHVAYLRRIFALAKEAEWITTNPAEHLARA